MKHRALPGTLTPENLAKWIKDNSLETIQHTEKTELEEEQVHELERQSSLASRAIDRLEAKKKEFLDVITNGTLNFGVDDDGNPTMPFDITVPPTKGLKVLKANRAFADRQLETGFKEEIIDIYKIPYPEDSLIVAVDIEGNEWPEYTKEMTIEQINQHKPMLKIPKEKKVKKDSFMDEAAETTKDLDL